MANQLLTNSQISELTGIFSSHFATFSSPIQNQISIIKQPINIINNVNENVLAGFGAESMNYTDVTYQPVTGVFPALIIYPKDLKSQQFGQLKFDLDENEVMIKVEQSTRDYIIQGKTEGVIANGLNYNIEITPSCQNFMSLKYYYFKLTSTK